MKLLLCFIIILGIAPLTHSAQSTPTVLEVVKIKVEYYDTSNRGIVRVINCTRCSKKIYKFNTPPVIKKNGKVISIENFISEHQKAITATLFLDNTTLSVERINFWTSL